VNTHPKDDKPLDMGQGEVPAGTLVMKFWDETSNEIVVVADRIGREARLGRGIGLEEIVYKLN